MRNEDRTNARGARGYDEVAKTPEDGEGDGEEGRDIDGETGKALESVLWGDCFWKVGFVGRRALYFDFVGAGAGTGTGVAVLDVSVEPDKEEGTLIADMESGSNGFLAFPSNCASSCVLANLDLAVIGVSVFSLDSLDEDSVGDDGRDCEREGESAGVEGVLER